MRLRMKQIVVILGAIMMVVFFQNCGQPGSISIDSEKLSSSGDVDVVDNSTPNPDAGPVYKDLTKTINVNETTNKADVLVVIDNSGSMRYEQQSMAQRFDTFISQLQGLDWRVAVTTTEVGSGKTDGQLLPMGSIKWNYISSRDSLSSAKDEFGSAIQRDANGSSREQGIYATYRALERALEPGSSNSEFFRNDAALSVIVVTDADETPYNGGPTLRNKESELRKLVAEKFPSKAFKFHSIIVMPDDTSCRSSKEKFSYVSTDGKVVMSENLNEDYGHEYAKLSLNTGGIIGSVCEADYGSQLKIIGQSTADLVKNISLECAPVDRDKDGNLDITITNTSSQSLITGFTVQGSQVVLSQPLVVGSYKVDYRCLVSPE